MRYKYWTNTQATVNCGKQYSIATNSTLSSSNVFIHFHQAILHMLKKWLSVFVFISRHKIFYSLTHVLSIWCMFSPFSFRMERQYGVIRLAFFLFLFFQTRKLSSCRAGRWVAQNLRRLEAENRPEPRCWRPTPCSVSLCRLPEGLQGHHLQKALPDGPG